MNGCLSQIETALTAKGNVTVSDDLCQEAGKQQLGPPTRSRKKDHSNAPRGVCNLCGVHHHPGDSDGICPPSVVSSAEDEAWSVECLSPANNHATTPDPPQFSCPHLLVCLSRAPLALGPAVLLDQFVQCLRVETRSNSNPLLLSTSLDKLSIPPLHLHAPAGLLLRQRIPYCSCFGLIVFLLILLGSVPSCRVTALDVHLAAKRGTHPLNSRFNHQQSSAEHLSRTVACGTHSF